MHIKEFVANFKNHPVLFIGTGLSLRYLQTSYTWNELLERISLDIHGHDEPYLNLKFKCYRNKEFCYEKIAEKLEEEFNNHLEINRSEKFAHINDTFFENMRSVKRISRFKLYISHLLHNMEYIPEQQEEIAMLKKVRKNIGSIITTNYDKLVEDIFKFDPLVGNDILLSNQYGAIYKIHGCVDSPDRIIITESDYDNFNKKYELIRAQLLSLFIHNPIIFIGYKIGDKNIKDILQTIFTYVEPNSAQAKKIRDNFLLIEYEPNSMNLDVLEYDVDIENFSTIQINRIKTNNFIEIYKELANILLPVSAMDIRKVQNVIREICYGGTNSTITVNITEDIEELKNADKVLVIGTQETITYVHQNTSGMMANYFKIIEEENIQLIELLNKQTISTAWYFPVFMFSTLTKNLENLKTLKDQQIKKLKSILQGIHSSCTKKQTSVQSISDDSSINQSSKAQAIVYHTYHNNLDLDDVKHYLQHMDDKNSTDYRKLLCAYDYALYNSNKKGNP